MITRYLHEKVEPQGNLLGAQPFHKLENLENLGLPEY